MKPSTCNVRNVLDTCYLLHLLTRSLNLEELKMEVKKHQAQPKNITHNGSESQRG